MAPCNLVTAVLRMTGGPGHAFGLAASRHLTLRGGQRHRTHLRGSEIFYDSTAELDTQYHDIARCVVQQCVRQQGARLSAVDVNYLVAVVLGERRPQRPPVACRRRTAWRTAS